MGKWSSLAPGGGSVYQQLRGSNVVAAVDVVGVVVGIGSKSSSHKVHLDKLWENSRKRYKDLTIHVHCYIMMSENLHLSFDILTLIGWKV